MKEKDYVKPAKEVLSYAKNIDYAFMFGSALKHPRSDSDIDILLGGDLSDSEKLDLAHALALRLGRNVDIVVLREARCELVSNVFSGGALILVNNADKLKKDYFRNFYLYDEGKKLRELRLSRIKRKYSHG